MIACRGDCVAQGFCNKLMLVRIARIYSRGLQPQPDQICKARVHIQAQLGLAGSYKRLEDSFFTAVLPPQVDLGLNTSCVLIASGGAPHAPLGSRDLLPG